MRQPLVRISALVASLLMGACASTPTAPTVLALKGSGKTFAEFGKDDSTCRRFAALQVRGVAPDQAAVQSGLIKDKSGQTFVPGVESPDPMTDQPQDLYNIAYIQCMYEQGHRVPVPGHVLFEDRLQAYPPPPPPPPTEGMP